MCGMKYLVPGTWYHPGTWYQVSYMMMLDIWQSYWWRSQVLRAFFLSRMKNQHGDATINNILVAWICVDSVRLCCMSMEVERTMWKNTRMLLRVPDTLVHIFVHHAYTSIPPWSTSFMYTMLLVAPVVSYERRTYVYTEVYNTRYARGKQAVAAVCTTGRDVRYPGSKGCYLPVITRNQLFLQLPIPVITSISRKWKLT